jgi:AcrR family transcriptional regulator
MSDEISRGRPRAARVDSAVAKATRDLLAKDGYARLSVEQVAARAGVGKSTIYRRWRSKAELVLGVVFGGQPIDAPADSGTLRGDLTAFVAAMIDRLSAPGVAWALPGLVSDIGGDDDLAARFAATVLAPEQHAISELLDRAVARGELPPEPEIEYAHAAVLGTIFGWLFLLRAPTPSDLRHRLAEQVAVDLLGAWPAPPPTPLALRRGQRGRPTTGPGRGEPRRS